MKFHLDQTPGSLRFTGYGDGYVQINDTRHDSGLWISEAKIEAAPWATLGFADLTPAHFDWLAARRTDILLLATGTRLRFPPPALIKPLRDARVGLEVMDIGALCRTYNILASEGRHVAAAIVFGTD